MLRVFKIIFDEILFIVDFVATQMPGRTGYVIRQDFFKIRVKETGENIRIGIGVEITGGENICVGNNINIMKYTSFYANDNGKIRLGDNVSINSNVCIGAANGGEILIKNNALIANNVVIRASDHAFESVKKPIIKQGHNGGKIVIGEDCWICANVVITKGVTIGDHSVVAAGSIVTNDVEPFSVVGGCPAKLIRKRDIPELCDIE